MSDDLENLLADLAAAEERTAEEGLLAEPTLPALLHRTATRVRRRRAARAAGASALALVVLGGTAGIVSALDDRTPAPPAATATPTPAGLSDPAWRCGMTLEEAYATRGSATLAVGGMGAMPADATWDGQATTVTMSGSRGVAWVTDTSLVRDGVIVAVQQTWQPNPIPAGVDVDLDEVAKALPWTDLPLVTDISERFVACGAPLAPGMYDVVVAQFVFHGQYPATGAYSGGWAIGEASLQLTGAPAELASATTCGVPDDQLRALSDPVTHPSVVRPAGYTWSAWLVDEAPGFFIWVSATGDEAPVADSVDVRLVLVRDGVVVGAGAFARGEAPSTTGDYGTFSLDQPVWACTPGEETMASVGGPLVEPGEYAAYVVSTLWLPDGSADVGIGGPWALSLLAAGSEPPPGNLGPGPDILQCGAAPELAEGDLPDVAGLRLAADLPTTGWSQGGAGSPWTVTLTSTGDLTVRGRVLVDLKVMLVGLDGVVAGYLYSGDGAWAPFTAAPGAPATVPGGGELGRCDQAAGPLVGQYWAWPYARVTLVSAAHADGTFEATPIGEQVVVGPPTLVTVGG